MKLPAFPPALLWALALGAPGPLSAGADSACKLVSGHAPAQYLEYVGRGEERPMYVGESDQVLWFRFYNNTSCPITILAGAPIVPVERPGGRYEFVKPYGDRVLMDFEATGAGQELAVAHGGCIVNSADMQGGESVRFAVPVNYIRRGPIAVRFHYAWEPGFGEVQHRVIFRPESLPDDVKAWLDTLPAEEQP